MAGERLRLSEKTINRYKDALELSHRRFEAEAKPTIEKMVKYFKGDQWESPNTAQDRKLVKQTVNLLFADVKVMLPVLALRHPRVFVKPTGATHDVEQMTPAGPVLQPAQVVNGMPVPILKIAEAKEALINWRWRQLRLVQQVRRCLVDALLAPFGVMKLGYALTTEKVALPKSPTGDAEVLEPNELIQAESPYAVRWSPMDFRMDPEARYPDLSDASWIAFGWKRRVGDVKKDERYRNTRDLQGTVEIKTDWGASADSSWDKRDLRGSDDDRKLVQLWQIWDKREHTLITLADDHDKALEYDAWPQVYKNFPAETLYFTEYPDVPYGPPDLWHMLGQQDAYNIIATMILDHVRKAQRKYMSTRGTLDETEKAKLLIAESHLIVDVDGKITESLAPIPDAPVPVDFWQASVKNREDHDRLTSVADFMRGQAEKVDTATEANLLQSNLNVRTNDTRAIVEDFAARISRSLLLIDAQTLELPHAIPVIGPDGAQVLDQYVRIADKRLLLADADVEIEMGSMQPVNELQRKQDMEQTVQLWRGDPMTDQFELRQKYAQIMKTSIPDISSVFLSRQQFQQMQQAMGQKSPPPRVSISLKGDLSPEMAADLTDGVVDGQPGGAGHPVATPTAQGRTPMPPPGLAPPGAAPAARPRPPAGPAPASRGARPPRTPARPAPGGRPPGPPHPPAIPPTAQMEGQV